MELSFKDLKELLKDEKNGDKIQRRGTTIVVLQRGWVMVGDLIIIGDECELRDARVIRVWGTTKGLGEIALNGPTPKTVLDDAGHVYFHRLTTICEISCNQEKWK
jgi:hypothetical protein